MHDQPAPPAPGTDLGTRTVLRRWLGAVSGVSEGCVLALAGLGALVWWMLARPLVPEAADRQAVRTAERELQRVTRWHGPVHLDRLTPARARRYVALRLPVGLLGLGVLLMLLGCLIVAGSMLSAWVLDGGWGLVEDGANGVSTPLVAMIALPGAMMIFVSAAGVFGVGTLDRWLATTVLGVRDEVVLRQRVRELASTRADVIAVLDDERRRIERDLHDGVQQRVVALAVLIGRARRATGDNAHANELLAQAQAVSSHMLGELREVAQRVYPSALDDAGLGAALEALTERSGAPVHLAVTLDGRLPGTVETVAYFVACEAVTNAVKHANPSAVTVAVTRIEDTLSVRVTDDGIGGADDTGTGLSGLARRVAAVDGALTHRAQPAGRADDGRGCAAVRVILADDSTLLREGLVRLLAEEGHDVVAAVGTATELLAATARHCPDIVVTDVRMPPGGSDDGLRAALDIRRDHPDTGVLVLSQYIQGRYATDLITDGTGRVGYLLKDRVAQVDDFLDALGRVAAGGTAFDPEVIRRLLHRTSHTDPLHRLTPREREVLALMAQGLTNARIAATLHISASGVEKHINAIFDKLGLAHTAGLSRRVLAVVRYLSN